MGAIRRTKLVQSLVDRKNFLDQRISEYLRNGRQSPAYDIQESQALEWVLSQLVEYTFNHSEDREWAEKLAKIVPVDKYLENIHRRSDNYNQRKTLKRLNLLEK